MSTTPEWIGWVRYDATPPWLETIDSMLACPGKYGARLHWAEGPGSKTACGTRVPADNPDVIRFFVSDQDDAPKCKRCLKSRARAGR